MIAPKQKQTNKQKNKPVLFSIDEGNLALTLGPVIDGYNLFWIRSCPSKPVKRGAYEREVHISFVLSVKMNISLEAEEKANIYYHNA